MNNSNIELGGIPEVSVVMAVHNGANRLHATVESIQAQMGISLELIIVDDGSTDATADELTRMRRQDPRIRIISNPHNIGLTRSLMHGCREARAPLIARQDCGDLTLPGRLAAQAHFLQNAEKCVAVTCSARYITQFGDELSTVFRREDEWDRGIRNLDVTRIKGPAHHGATMFRKAAYERVGGYREQFTVAQDLDLWIRLSEIGSLGSLAQVGYVAELAAGSISATRRASQQRFTQYAIDCAHARQRGEGDLHIQVPKIKAEVTKWPLGARIAAARHNYFVGAWLAKTNSRAALRYLRAAVRGNPFDLRAWAKLLLLKRIS